MRNKGFTLIELLIVIGIIGILASIAVPQFASYKTAAFNATAQSDLRNVMTAQEAYFETNQRYAQCLNAVTSGACDSTLPGFVASEGARASSFGNELSYHAYTCHDKGDRYFLFTNAGPSETLLVGFLHRSVIYSDLFVDRGTGSCA